MSWNNGYERKKFELAQRRQAAKYRKLGMTEEQIEAMYKFDLEQYRPTTSPHSKEEPLMDITISPSLIVGDMELP